MSASPGSRPADSSEAERSQLFPQPGFGRSASRPEKVLLICYFDPEGISTVIETVASMQMASRFSVSVLNIFEHRLDTGYLRLHPWLNLEHFDAVVIHNTVSYNVDNLRSLDRGLRTTLREYTGVKVILKQDENYRFKELARYIGETGFDLLLTCLPPEAVPLVYPPAVAGSPRIERMLTGYVTATLRDRGRLAGPRPVDIGYRGSIQPISFGWLAYEKRKIGADVARRLARRTDVQLDISSRWEDRLGGDAWLRFLSSCKATLGAESGASIFDFEGDLEARCEGLLRKYAHLDEDERTEAALRELADLEGNVHYNQLSPRHFEAIACGAIQLLYPGSYSGVMEAGRHYLQLERDGSNLEELVAIVRDEKNRLAMAQRAFDEVVMNPENWVETFVSRLDDWIDDALRKKGRARVVEATVPPARHAVLIERVEASGAAPAAATERGTALHRLHWGADLASAPPDTAGGQLRWNVPKAEAGQPLDWLGGVHQKPALAVALQSLLHLEHLLALPQLQLCAELGIPPGLPGDLQLRRKLEEASQANRDLVAAAGRMRGVQAVLVRGPQLMPAAVFAKVVWDVPLILIEEQAAALPAERLWWMSWQDTLMRHVDHAVSIDEAPAVLADVLREKPVQPLRVYEAHRSGSAYQVPAELADQPAPLELRPSLFSVLVAGLARSAPAPVRKRLAALARRLGLV